MAATTFPIERLRSLETPFYYYDLDLLRSTLAVVAQFQQRLGYKVHYAIKANANPRLLAEIRQAGLGIDCVSGNEVQCALDNGFDPQDIVFAGVGKADWEIRLALNAGIGCFNVESLPELEVIDALARQSGRRANIALRINPNVDAHTHQYITTGLEENKFGIGLWELDSILDAAMQMQGVALRGIHFHIGSQITDLDAFKALCSRVNEISKRIVEQRKLPITIINVGGGLGIDYEHPDAKPITDFEAYFTTFHRFLDVRAGQEVHFELGRAIVAQCGSLISRVLYVKKGQHKQFVIIDAGMNDLIRPALYHAYHKIENLTSIGAAQKYDVVGPVCESSDCFGLSQVLPLTQRGDLIAIRSAGAYGEVMASHYNLRKFAQTYFSN